MTTCRRPKLRTARLHDGAPELGPYDDSSTAAAALATDTMRFFKDDDVVLGEDSAGAVSRIRVYEGALTAAEVAALSPLRPPPPDSDGDGVRDSADTCPTVPAPTPDGCPQSAWQRKGSLQHARTLQLGHRSRHRLDGDRPLRRHAHHRQERQGRGS